MLDIHVYSKKNIDKLQQKIFLLNVSDKLRLCPSAVVGMRSCRYARIVRGILCTASREPRRNKGIKRQMQCPEPLLLAGRWEFWGRMRLLPGPLRPSLEEGFDGFPRKRSWKFKLIKDSTQSYGTSPFDEQPSEKGEKQLKQNCNNQHDRDN